MGDSRRPTPSHRLRLL